MASSYGGLGDDSAVEEGESTPPEYGGLGDGSAVEAGKSTPPDGPRRSLSGLLALARQRKSSASEEASYLSCVNSAAFSCVGSEAPDAPSPVFHAPSSPAPPINRAVIHAPSSPAPPMNLAASLGNDAPVDDANHVNGRVNIDDITRASEDTVNDDSDSVGSLDLVVDSAATSINRPSNSVFAFAPSVALEPMKKEVLDCAFNPKQEEVRQNTSAPC